MIHSIVGNRDGQQRWCDHGFSLSPLYWSSRSPTNWVPTFSLSISSPLLPLPPLPRHPSLFSSLALSLSSMVLVYCDLVWYGPVLYHISCRPAHPLVPVLPLLPDIVLRYLKGLFGWLGSGGCELYFFFMFWWMLSFNKWLTLSFLCWYYCMGVCIMAHWVKWWLHDGDCRYLFNCINYGLCYFDRPPCFLDVFFNRIFKKYTFTYCCILGHIISSYFSRFACWYPYHVITVSYIHVHISWQKAFLEELIDAVTCCNYLLWCHFYLSWKSYIFCHIHGMLDLLIPLWWLWWVSCVYGLFFASIYIASFWLNEEMVLCFVF